MREGGRARPAEHRHAATCALPVAVALAGCAGPKPPAEPVRAPVSTSNLRSDDANGPTAYRQEVDELFRALAEEAASGGAPAAPSRTTRAAYDENLAICLDGRWFAFCDHERLSRDDKARVAGAEHTANQVTCIDPEWQHLCRPELLPGLTRAP
jgi:hypothetical protein